MRVRARRENAGASPARWVKPLPASASTSRAGAAAAKGGGAATGAGAGVAGAAATAVSALAVMSAIVPPIGTSSPSATRRRR